MARDIWHMTEVAAFTVKSVTTCLACYGYIKWIDKLSLRQYRACVVDSLGLGIVFYNCTMCTRHSDLVSLDFYAIPLFTCIHIQRS